MKIIKLGGSLITNKEEVRSLNPRVLRRVCEEIKSGGERVVVVHGAGSFGHPFAKEYGLHEGFSDDSQLEGLFECYAALQELHERVLKALNEAGVRAVSFRPYTNCVADKGRVKKFFVKPLKWALKLGLTPVLCGDVVVDESTGFSVVSGDQIAPLVGEELGCEQLVFAGAVDGVLDDGGGVVEEITSLQEVKGLLGGGEGVDVTGGMLGKVSEVFESCQGCEALIINGLVSGRVEKALKGERVVGTIIRRVG